MDEIAFFVRVQFIFPLYISLIVPHAATPCGVIEITSVKLKVEAA